MKISCCGIRPDPVEHLTEGVPGVNTVADTPTGNLQNAPTFLKIMPDDMFNQKASFGGTKSRAKPGRALQELATCEADRSEGMCHTYAFASTKGSGRCKLKQGPRGAMSASQTHQTRAVQASCDLTKHLSGTGGVCCNDVCLLLLGA